jgi:hypothetical protein
MVESEKEAAASDDSRAAPDRQVDNPMDIRIVREQG